MNGHYPAQAPDGAWRRFQTARGIRLGSFDATLRAFEAAVPALNLPPDSVHLAAELAALEPALEANERLALIALTLASMAALNEGSTRFPVAGPLGEQPLARMLSVLTADDASFAAQLSDTIRSMLRERRATAIIGYERDAARPLLYFAPYIYQQRIDYVENLLAGRLRAMLATPASNTQLEVEAALAQVIHQPVVIQGSRIEFTEEQRAAIAAAGAGALTVISGGPGTGKTSIVVAILRLLARLGIAPEKIALAAPTGKAAHRLGECIAQSLAAVESRDDVDRRLLEARFTPATIHRLLGYSPESGRFRHHRNNPLPADAVIVDEGSMLDLELAERLAGAIGSGARLVILGDGDQLPSVSAGSVFRDLLELRARGAMGAVRLTENHRMKRNDAGARAVLAAVNAIKAGAAPAATRRDAADAISFSGVEMIAAAERERFLVRWYEARVRGDEEIAALRDRVYVERDGGFDAADCARLSRLFAHAASSRILCVTRVYETGAERINSVIHARATRDAEAGAERARFVPGEPLVVLHNDYERGLFNGDHGLVLRVRRAGARRLAMAVFPRGDNFAAFRIDALGDSIELGYAMTVHKAQGSEFDAVAFVLPDEPMPMLTRELTYTALSRSRESAVIAGDDATMAHAIANRVERFSGLAERIAGAAPA